VSVIAPVPRPYRSTANLGRALRILLACDAAVALINVIGGIAAIGRIHAMTSFGSDVLLSGTVPQPLPTGLSLLLSFVAIATGIVWLVWQHRAQSNLFAMRAPDLDFTPGWAVGWWFVPVANFFMPFKTMRELSRGSGDNRNTVLTGWWASWIGRFSLLLIAAVVGVGGLVRSPVTNRIVGYRVSSTIMVREIIVVGYALSAVAAMLALHVVRGIDEAQAARIEQGVLVPPRPDRPRPDVGADSGTRPS